MIVSIDPGREKCGLAVVSENLEVKARKVVSTEEIINELNILLEEFRPTGIIIGSGTYSKKIREKIKDKFEKIPLDVVDESHSTEQARKKYFKENPPRGLWRLIPLSLQVPSQPYDDYAAIVLAEKYFNKENKI